MENTTKWFLDVEGDLFGTREEAEVCGLAKVITTPSMYVGSIEDWKKSILANLNA